jgi:methionyl-tRNA formyltransferase
MASGNNRVVFFGTSAVCLPFLEVLHAHFNLALVITQPDALGGRNKHLIVPPVKTFALDQGIDFVQPAQVRDQGLADRIRDISPAVAVVISYGQFIPKSIFSIPGHGTVNVHFSLLPQYRGAAPVQRAIENGEQKTGITIFDIDCHMDSGAIWAVKEFDIFKAETAGDLLTRLSHTGAPFLEETLAAILAGRSQKIPQDHGRATLAPAVLKEEGRVDWTWSAGQILNKQRAFTPWPGLFCLRDNKIFKLTRLRPLADAGTIASVLPGKNPGDVLGLDKEGLKVCCGQHTVLEILEFQPEGKKPMTPFCYCLGHPLPAKLD